MLTILLTTELYNHITTAIKDTKWVELRKGLLLGRRKLNNYFPQKDILASTKYDLYSFSILLDPRLKEQFFREILKWDKEQISYLVDRFKMLWIGYRQRYRPNGPITTDDTELSQNIHLEEEVPRKSLTTRLYQQYMDTSAESYDKREVDAYLAEARCPANTIPNKWWAIYGQKYPILSLVAQDYLAIMATSASIEREFSKLSDITTRKRGRLSAERVNQLICLKSWADIAIEEEDLEDNDEESD